MSKNELEDLKVFVDRFFGTDPEDIATEIFSEGQIKAIFANLNLEEGDLQEDAEKAIEFFAQLGYDYKIRLSSNSYVLVPNTDEW